MRMLRCVCRVGLCCIGTLLAGCGGSGTNGGAVTNNASATSVTVTFNSPLAPPTVAAQTGSAPFAAAPLQGNQLTISLPSATSKYSLAWTCTFHTMTFEYVLEATPQDGTAYSVGCQSGLLQPTGSAPPMAGATGSVDASAIAGTAFVGIFGKQGGAGVMNAASGAFNFNMPSGMNDVAVVAVDASFNVLAVKIVRTQTVPGAINSGNTIVLGSADLLTTAPLNFANLPGGFDAPQVQVTYVTAGGTPVRLTNFNVALTQYPTAPAASVASGDFYQFQIQTSDTATHASTIQVTQNMNGGGAVTIPLPPAWQFSGPAAAALPTFTFSYPGFAGVTTVTQQAGISCQTSPSSSLLINILATGSFQNGATTLVIPDLSKVPGFPSSLPSGATVEWNASISGGAAPEVNFLPSLPAKDSIVAIVGNMGHFVVP